MGITIHLPTFKGYTIDVKLGQFRKVAHGDSLKIEFIEFDSEKGQELLLEIRVYFSFLFE